MTVWFILWLVDSFGWLNDSLIVCLFLSRLSLVHCDLVLFFLFVIYLHQKLKTRWWFQLWFPTQGNDPIWRAYFFQMSWFNHQLENYKNPCCLRFCASVTTTFMLFFCSDRCDPDKVLLSYTCRRLVDLPGATPPQASHTAMEKPIPCHQKPQEILEWDSHTQNRFLWELCMGNLWEWNPVPLFFWGGSDPNSPERFCHRSTTACLSGLFRSYKNGWRDESFLLGGGGCQALPWAWWFRICYIDGTTCAQPKKSWPNKPVMENQMQLRCRFGKLNPTVKVHGTDTNTKKVG